ncbi:hypothetical protein JCM10450v2_005311 [Rhodotorula kratochvilovae]
MADAADAASAPWIPLGNKRDGVLAVAVAATASLVLLTSLGGYVSLLLGRYRSGRKAGRFEKETRAIRFLASTHGVGFISLLCGDLLQATAFSMNYYWVARGSLPSAAYPTPLCTAQAVIVQCGDLISAFSSLIIGTNLFLIIVCKITPSLRWVLSAIAFAWVMVGIFAGIGPALHPPEAGRDPFYGPAGGWCWMNAAYQSERLTCHYLWVFLVAGTTLLLYSIMAAQIWWRLRQLGDGAPLSTGTTGVAKVMMLYPFIYVASVVPLAVYRCATMAGHDWPIQYALAGGFIWALSGTADCITYALTRHIVSLEGIGDAIRRRSSGSGSGNRLSIDIRRLSSALAAHRPSLEPCMRPSPSSSRPDSPSPSCLPSFSCLRASQHPSAAHSSAIHAHVDAPTAADPAASPLPALERPLPAHAQPPRPPGTRDFSAYSVQWAGPGGAAPAARGAGAGGRRSSEISPLERPFARLEALALAREVEEEEEVEEAKEREREKEEELLVDDEVRGRGTLREVRSASEGEASV